LITFNAEQPEQEPSTSSESIPIVSLDEFVQTQSQLGTRRLERTATQQKSEKTIAASGIEETQINVEVQRERSRTWIARKRNSSTLRSGNSILKVSCSAR
jgi:hypothetical protein